MALKWYVLHVYSGFEKKVAESIKEQAEKKGWTDKIADVLVPTEAVVDIQKGKKVQVERKFFPSYVLVQMEMNDDTWHMIKNTPKVTGFLGGLTTFSTFSTESVGFLLDGAWSRWGRHLLFHVVGGLAAATAGVLPTRWILR